MVVGLYLTKRRDHLPRMGLGWSVPGFLFKLMVWVLLFFSMSGKWGCDRINCICVAHGKTLSKDNGVWRGYPAGDRFSSKVTQERPRIRFSSVSSSFRNYYVVFPPASKLKDGELVLRLEWDPIHDAQRKSHTMVAAFPPVTKMAQALIYHRILMYTVGRLHDNSMHPSNVFLLQVLREIMIWFYIGKLTGFMIGGRADRCLSNNHGMTVKFIGACRR